VPSPDSIPGRFFPGVRMCDWDLQFILIFVPVQPGTELKHASEHQGMMTAERVTAARTSSYVWKSSVTTVELPGMGHNNLF